jgi:hypothetical protein
VWRRTARKRLRTSIKNCKEWVKTHRHYPLAKLLPTMIRKVRGHYNYFRAVGNGSSLWVFYREVVELLYKWLNRRSQRRSLTWDGIKRVLAVYAFPTPTQSGQPEMNRGVCVKSRFTARVSMIEEPGAGKPHAGICAGGVG